MATTEPRRIDRHRRARIVEGVIKLMEEEGVTAVSHRRAAAKAEVPLAATTYYFNSLDDLMAAALREIVRRDMLAMHELLDDVGPDADLAELFARMVCGWAAAPGESVIITELFAFALRNEQLREVSLEWLQAESELFEPLIGPRGTRAVMATMAGLTQRLALQREEPPLEEITAIFRQVLRGDD